MKRSNLHITTCVEMEKPPFSTKIKRGSTTFTLIELLVVLAIIAMLAALLLPSLRMAKEVGMQVQCLNNMKQNGTAINLYVNDYYRYVPCFSYSTGMTWYALLWKYHKNADTLHCPKDLNPDYKMTSVGGPGAWPLKVPTGLTNGLSYICNGYLPTYNFTLHKMIYWRITKYHYPNRTHFMMDGTNTYLPLGWNATTYPYVWLPKVYTATRWHARHDKRINVLYLDGHATTLTKNTILLAPHSMQTSPNLEMKIFWRGY